MMPLAAIVAAVLVVIALLHLAWALGLWTPIRDEARLARHVIGTRGVIRMPGAVPCALVAVALAFVASLPFTPELPGQRILLILAGGVFVARGLAAYMPSWRRLTPEADFARLDRRLYGPLCLLVGAALLILSAMQG